jgi:hypothetical protein
MPDANPLAEIFVPTLAWPGRRPSLSELATWHEALRDAVANLFPLDLMAFWVLPSRGEALLVGPAELAADQLPVPPAEPLIAHEGLFQLEDRIRSAGYGSVMAVPVRSEVQDVGILLVASFGAEQYSRDQLRTLHRAANLLAVTCRRLAAQLWIIPAAPTEERTAMIAGVTTALLDALDRARTGSELVQLASDALAAQLPHDRLELLAVAPAPDCWTLLALDGQPSRDVHLDAIELDQVDALVHCLGGSENELVSDLHDQGLIWPWGADQRVAARQRALCAARLEVGGELVGWLWLGSDTPGWFTDTDREVARLAARLLSSRVATWAARKELAGAWA